MKIQSFTVLPSAPEKLEPLVEIAYNMWYAWNHEAADLFKALDPQVWKASRQNPVMMLSMLPREKLEEAEQNAAFVKRLKSVHTMYRQYMDGPSWYHQSHPDKPGMLTAYFCAEYGLHESLPIYSGGLGVLAGDHLKTASDLGIPLVAVGLLYREGFFRQFLNADGMQTEWYAENDWYSLPVKLVRDKNGRPLVLAFELGKDTAYFQTWKVNVGRVTLYLMDTNIGKNSQPFRDITKRLYDSDREMRIRQEFLLGIGGIRFLEAMELRPSIYHINEGHSAFLLLERLSRLVNGQKLGLAEARELVWGTTVFTTHTPVPAGNERFEINLMEKYLKNYIQTLGLSWEELLSLGRENPADEGEAFCMTVLALKLAAFANGVSRLHGRVSREMWQRLYPDLPLLEIPIGHVTNGIHAASWMSPQLKELLAKHLGASFTETLFKGDKPDCLSTIPARSLWKIRQERRSVLIRFTRAHMRKLEIRRGASPGDLAECESLLDPDALTIGFARRFATYKRGSLFLRHPERLKKILLNQERPVQFILAGKAHPADKPGKEIIQYIFRFARENGLRRRLVFLEDYDMNIARHLVQGVDVWLNTPRRPMEASGTSGMKAAINGCLNFSIMDGWWDEGYSPKTGWKIGHGETYTDTNFQDELEGDLLYHILEKEIIPLFYSRDKSGIPIDWVDRMKCAISHLGAGFNMERMLIEYIENYYLKAHGLCVKMSDNQYKKTRELSEWKKKLAESWDEVAILNVISSIEETIYAGDELTVSAALQPGPFIPENLCVEVYHGRLDNEGKIRHGFRERMTPEGKKGKTILYKASIPCELGGRYGFTVRVLPGHRDLATDFLPGFMKWA